MTNIRAMISIFVYTELILLIKKLIEESWA